MTQHTASPGSSSQNGWWVMTVSSVEFSCLFFIKVPLKSIIYPAIVHCLYNLIEGPDEPFNIRVDFYIFNFISGPPPPHFMMGCYNLEETSDTRLHSFIWLCHCVPLLSTVLCTIWMSNYFLLYMAFLQCHSNSYLFSGVWPLSTAKTISFGTNQCW